MGGIGSRGTRQRTAEDRGFTLIEMLVTIAVLGILVAAALPSMVDIIRSNRASSEVNALLTMMTLTRSEAIKRNQTVTACKTADGLSCSAAATWADGVLVFVDTDGDGAYDSTATGDDEETLIAVESPLAPRSDVSWNGGGNTIVYRPDGRASPFGSFLLTPNGESAATRKLTINWMGRPSVCTPDASENC